MGLIHFGRVVPNPEWHMARHCHEQFGELIVVLGGKLLVQSESGRLQATTGDILHYPAGCWHEEWSDTRQPTETIFFGVSGLPGSGITIVHDRDGRVRTLSRWIMASRADSYACIAGVRASFFDALLAEYCRVAADPGAGQMVTTVRSYIIDHINEGLDVQRLATQACMSRYHFIRQYRLLSGATPMADVRRMRAEEAANLLATTNLPLKAIAPMVGMANEFHLARMLKRCLGFGARHLRAH
jgi:AraC-like DNA-binding protein